MLYSPCIQNEWLILVVTNDDKKYGKIRVYSSSIIVKFVDKLWMIWMYEWKNNLALSTTI